MAMRKDRELKDYIQQSALTLADGQPLIWLSSLLGKPLEERIAGIDYCARICSLAEQNNYSVFLLGASSIINRRVQGKLETLHPDIKIVGALDGYFSVKEASEKVKLIAATGADILIVAMGSPRQEYFIKSHWENLGVKLAIPVGGSFEVWASRRKRAPRWMQRAGLEWVMRMLQDFPRLAPRYAVTNIQFLWYGFMAYIQSVFRGRTK